MKREAHSVETPLKHGSGGGGGGDLPSVCRAAPLSCPSSYGGEQYAQLLVTVKCTVQYTKLPAQTAHKTYNVPSITPIWIC